MNRIHLSSPVLILSVIGLFLPGACSRKTTEIPTLPGMKLVWNDEFNYKGRPDTTKWTYDIGGHGWGNRELQYYTDRLENARVEGGKLVIEARKEDFEDSHYTSCRLVTRGKAEWRYGCIEVRAKLPQGLGTWPAIWMLGAKQHYGDQYWPHNGEIDIMEHVGYDPGIVHASIHTKAFYHSIGTQKTAKIPVPTAMTEFHTYRMDWSADAIRTYVDDQLYFTFTNDGKGWEHWPFDQPQYLLLNIAFGGNWGAAKGIDPAVLPQRMEVDWVRVWQGQ